MSSDEKVYGGYTRAQLKAAFDIVKNRENWKYPIDTDIPSDSDFDMIEAAVIFFTGSVPFTADSDQDGMTRIMAAGYYTSIGSLCPALRITSSPAPSCWQSSPT